MIKLVFEHSKQELIKDENDLHYVLAKLDKVRLRATLLPRVHANATDRVTPAPRPHTQPEPEADADEAKRVSGCLLAARLFVPSLVWRHEHRQGLGTGAACVCLPWLLLVALSCYMAATL